MKLTEQSYGADGNFVTLDSYPVKRRRVIFILFDIINGAGLEFYYFLNHMAMRELIVIVDSSVVKQYRRLFLV